MDRNDCVRPARRTALIGLKLQRYNIDIAALSETRLADTGSITEVGAGYTFFWSGKAADERREAGVGFAICTSLVRHLESLPKGINYRLMMLRLPLKGKTNLTLISAYDPTMCYNQEQEEQFYQSLTQLLHSVPKDDKLLLLGDFNARVCRDSQSWPDVIGPHGIGQENFNGQLLLTFCVEYGLSITNTMFHLPDVHKATWMHPRSKHWHLIDYVIIRRRDIQDVHITRAIRGADSWTDHVLLRSKLPFSITSAHRYQKADIKKKLDVRRLADPETKATLVAMVSEEIENLPTDASSAILGPISVMLCTTQPSSLLGIHRGNTRIGSTATTQRLSPYWSRSRKLLQAGLTTKAQLPNMPASSTSGANASLFCGVWRTSGGRIRRLNCNSTQTKITTRSSSLA